MTDIKIESKEACCSTEAVVENSSGGCCGGSGGCKCNSAESTKETAGACC